MAIMARRRERESILIFEGVEYDLSNLLVTDEVSTDDSDSFSSLNNMVESSIHSSTTTSSISENSSAPKGRGRLARMWSSSWSMASTIFDSQAKIDKAQCPSPYRFDLAAMKILMSSFRGIPEVEDSSQLGICGQVEVSDVNDQSFATNLDLTRTSQEEAFFSTKRFETKEDDGSGLDDLIYDESKGTYVYKDVQVMNSSSHSQSCRQEEQDLQERYTLEELCDSAQTGRFDDYEHEMEISPGVYVPFRGAKETWKAVDAQHIAELVCLDCCIPLVCIEDCEFTVCPDCRVVNPVVCKNHIRKPFGVGMGFKKEWVLQKMSTQEQLQQPAAKQPNKSSQDSQRRMVRQDGRRKVAPN